MAKPSRKRCCRLFMLISDNLHSTGCNDVPHGNQQCCVVVHSCTFFCLLSSTFTILKHFLWCWVVSKGSISFFVLSLSLSLFSQISCCCCCCWLGMPRRQLGFVHGHPSHVHRSWRYCLYRGRYPLTLNDTSTKVLGLHHQ